MKKLLTLSLGLICVMFSYTQTATVIYSFNTDATDISGNSNNGTLSVGTSCYNTLKIGNNSTNYLSVPAVTLDGLTDFSINFKINFKAFHVSGLSPTNHILSGSKAGCVQCFGFSYEKNALVWRFAFNGAVLDWPDADVESKTPYCISLTRTGSTITLYKNGVSLGTNTSASVIDISSLIIGQEDDCVGGCFVANQSMWAYIDNFQIWNGEKITCSIENNGGAFADVDNLRALNEDVSEITIYPNPAKDKLYIDYQDDMDLTVKLVDVSGRIVFSSDIAISELDVKSLGSGIYFIIITNGAEQKVVSQKLVIE